MRLSWDQRGKSKGHSFKYKSMMGSQKFQKFGRSVCFTWENLFQQNFCFSTMKFPIQTHYVHRASTKLSTGFCLLLLVLGKFHSFRKILMLFKLSIFFLWKFSVKDMPLLDNSQTVRIWWKESINGQMSCMWSPIDQRRFQKLRKKWKKSIVPNPKRHRENFENIDRAWKHSLLKFWTLLSLELERLYEMFATLWKPEKSS